MCLFTLLLASAQLVSSLGRMGMNYSFAVLLPRQVDAAAGFRLTSTYNLFSLSSSLLVAGVALWQLARTSGLAPMWHSQSRLFADLILAYLLSDASLEILWSIHLALGRFRAVFLRDVGWPWARGYCPWPGRSGWGPWAWWPGLDLSAC